MQLPPSWLMALNRFRCAGRGRLAVKFKKPDMGLENVMGYSFCETMSASATTPWHIRPLTDKGLKLGGGADTKSLCGREVAWDLRVPVQKHGSCRKCWEKYQNAVNG